MRHVPFAVFTAAGLLFASPASAAIDIYFCSQTLPGESLSTGFAGCIDVLGTSNAAFVEGTTAEMRDFRFTKYVDSASTVLRRFLVTRQRVGDGTFWFRPSSAGATGPAGANMSIRLFQFTVTSVSSTASGGEDRLTESVSLAPQEIEFMYKRTTGQQATFYTCWNIAQGTVVNGQC